MTQDSSYRAGFDGKLAFVTGAGSGIGAATARLLASEGCALALADIDLAAAQALADELKSQGAKAQAWAVNVADSRSVEEGVRGACEAHGGLDFAVNAAGITGHLMACGDYDIELWQRVLSVNLTGTFLCMRAQIQQMERKGAGAIVNISSIMGKVALAGTAAYVASKHGTEGLTKAAALDYATKNIRINAVAPGYVDTPMIAGRKAATNDRIVAMHPMGRIGEPHEIAAAIVFLLSPRASFITGAIHAVDGGFTTR
jgi:NAD(P)-dependent dehydrogenase (short-subunit alcohol dehydrogenase family)